MGCSLKGDNVSHYFGSLATSADQWKFTKTCTDNMNPFAFSNVHYENMKNVGGGGNQFDWGGVWQH